MIKETITTEEQPLGQKLAMETLVKGVMQVATALESSTVSTSTMVDTDTMSYAAIIVARRLDDSNQSPNERLLELIALACGGSALTVLDAFFRKVGVSPEETQQWAAQLTKLIMEQVEAHMDEVVDRLTAAGGEHVDDNDQH
ncbi:MAG: hypothetical protein M0R06_22045 [Sphaerochaeta sp.]|jgi:methylphosphotriester-DNA--protein-cysteine methyltransferase|nr:hypothetical protein [Sphaerochaeta sp.]